MTVVLSQQEFLHIVMFILFWRSHCLSLASCTASTELTSLVTIYKVSHQFLYTSVVSAISKLMIRLINCHFQELHNNFMQVKSFWKLATGSWQSPVTSASWAFREESGIWRAVKSKSVSKECIHSLPKLGSHNSIVYNWRWK